MSRIIDKQHGPPYIEYLLIMLLSLLTFRSVSWIEVRKLYLKEVISGYHKQI
ncbi:hypothetical protein JOC85_001911 [Bacillus mesophilus]|nr:hypothetical protein [Bacillus mesophilus]